MTLVAGTGSADDVDAISTCRVTEIVGITVSQENLSSTETHLIGYYLLVRIYLNILESNFNLLIMSERVSNCQKNFNFVNQLACLTKSRRIAPFLKPQ